MYKLATATFLNNSLKLDNIFNFDEGKKLKIIIFDDEEKSKTQFFDFIQKNQINIPTDFKINRDELYER